MGVPHKDDEFHMPTNDDPYWSETCWFTFNVPERRLSGQFYPYFQANLNVTAAGVYIWDDKGNQPWNCRYMKNFWHLPFPTTPLSSLELANGIRYRCTEPQSVFELYYDDPDGDDLHVDLTFTAVARTNYLGEHHLDQPGRYTGSIVLDGETIEVDSFGFRDRSWGPRSQFGPGRPSGYDFATASADEGFFMISMDAGDGYKGVHGNIVRDGEWSKATGGRRTVVERDPSTGAPIKVALDITDEAGRSLHAEGDALNRIGVHLNPNMYTWMSLYQWKFDGLDAIGEDHDNWGAATARRHFRPLLGF